jgi:Ras-related protein Rab-18
VYILLISRVTFIVYDVTNRETFDALKTWWNEINTYCSSPDVVKMLIGNKVDKDASRVVSYDEGAAMARKLQTLFIECSAKTNVAVKDAFEELVTKIIETPSLWQKQSSNESNVRVSSESNTFSSGANDACSC